MTADETAKAILKLINGNDQLDLGGNMGRQYDAFSIPDLQRMARLWLMRDEILQYLSIRRLPARDYIVTLSGESDLDLFARIKALENEDEQA